jgi:hypothetical protein
VRSLAWGLAASLAVAACALPPLPSATPPPPSAPPATASPVIDTWPIGPEIGCNYEELFPNTSCAEIIAVGHAGLDERNAGHAPVASTEFHERGVDLDPATGRPAIHIGSGPCCAVLVFRLADGSVRAIGVGAPGIGPLIAIPATGPSRR